MQPAHSSYAKIALYDSSQIGYNGPMMREDINMTDLFKQLHDLLDAGLASGQINISEYDIIRYNLLKAEFST